MSDYTEFAQANDIVKSQGKFAMLTVDAYGNKAWKGTLKYMRAGEGYMFRRNADTEAAFCYPNYDGQSRYSGGTVAMSAPLHANSSATSMTLVAEAEGIDAGVQGDELDFVLEHDDEVLASATGRTLRYVADAALGTPDQLVAIRFVSSHGLVGGIAGYNVGMVANCYNLGRVYTGSSYSSNVIGGIVGQNSGSGKILNCFVRAHVSTDVSGNSFSGPVCGNNQGTISHCFYMNGQTANAGLVITDGADNASTISGSDGQTLNVLLSGRTLYGDGAWNTLCLPFALPGAGYEGYSPIAGATVMELEATSCGFEASTGTLTLKFKEATRIEAGKPYILRWDEAIAATATDQELANPLFLGVEVASQTESQRTIFFSISGGKVDFIGTFSNLAIQGEDRTLLYLGTGNNLYYPSAAMSIGACRAYFKLDGIEAGNPTSTKGIRAFDLNFSDK